jgi:hypothetical protein
MEIKTAKGARFYTDKPAKSPTITVLNAAGRPIMDTLKITGKTTEVVEFMEPLTMIEVEYSFGTTEVSEDYLFQ